jgi:glucosamine-6-phosphate deaminase
MDVIITPTAEEASLVAARHFEAEIRQNPAAVLGLATGSTPLRLYKALIDARLDWARIRTFNLDEYLGLGPDHPQSYHYFMWENLFNHVNIRRENVSIPDGLAQNVSASCSA